MNDPRFFEGTVCAALPATYDKLKHKAYIYLTAGRDLLVFRQPDQPHVGLQIPGGTVDPGESHLGAALREFHEETGLAVTHALDTLCEQLVLFDNEVGRDVHSRRLYHAATAPGGAARQRDRWEHYEMTPSAGGDPVRFELFWMDIDQAIDAGTSRFFTGFHAPLADLRTRLETSA
ncbi:NUDIX domain-containing protein [Stappia sp. ES.058]|uniref:NUDIX hydrolase n=1 Tax=Stappia sp. ES.058 TaxID=1881061 RepID=UPI00087B0EA9|nr:NUDIX domain-containing protein [Stappia sp. ES.058]SDU41255.1 ADP-ribose pyrophosphatase YjhB, NUDIX family [Stappia sp. ES.058]